MRIVDGGARQSSTTPVFLVRRFTVVWANTNQPPSLVWKRGGKLGACENTTLFTSIISFRITRLEVSSSSAI